MNTLFSQLFGEYVRTNMSAIVEDFVYIRPTGTLLLFGRVVNCTCAISDCLSQIMRWGGRKIHLLTYLPNLLNV